MASPILLGLLVLTRRSPSDAKTRRLYKNLRKLKQTPVVPASGFISMSRICRPRARDKGVPACYCKDGSARLNGEIVGGFDVSRRVSDPLTRASNESSESSIRDCYVVQHRMRLCPLRENISCLDPPPHFIPGYVLGMVLKEFTASSSLNRYPLDVESLRRNKT
ncbi:hypothetical protein J6590_056509 [Homalodisca vitripennis]|nr:hypothetical protein J6590_056509 [Homalodisca vitripennis]